MAELGYHRNAKKCKEKFENVYKYHKRTKDGRASKSDGKTYRFFDQLEALENNPPLLLPPPPQPRAPVIATTTMTVSMPGNLNPPIVSQYTIPSLATVVTNVNPISSSVPLPPQPPAPTTVNATNPFASTILPSLNPKMSATLMSYSTSSSTSSDDHPERRAKRKRKWEDFFERLMKEMMEKQEDLQKKFLETLEKRERDRMVREEAWRVQEMARMNREHELLVQERSLAAAKDAAVIAFLQKATEQQNPQSLNTVLPQILQMQLVQAPEATRPTPPPPPQPQQQQPHPPPIQQPPQPPTHQTPSPLVLAKIVDTAKTDNGGENLSPASSSRWPKAEIEALINIRTNLDVKYQENGPKGPLWEEISAAMGKLGYNRSAKRCKEKWENINKYFRKVKESNKKRPEDAKTCPYFHQLDALYKEKSKTDTPFNPIPIMVQPEQQWPLPQQLNQTGSGGIDDNQRENFEQNDMEDEDEEEEEEEEDAAGYEIVTNRPSSVATTVV